MNRRFFWFLLVLSGVVVTGCFLKFGKPPKTARATPLPTAPAAATPVMRQSAPPANLAPVEAPGTNAVAVTNASHVGINPAPSPELDSAVNPYAGALREPGKSKRPWDPAFLASLGKPVAGDPIRFELTAGRMAEGTIQITQLRGGDLTYVSGELTRPEPGKFFFLSPPAGGKAGKAVGVVEFPASKTAYRIEPTGENGAPELWQRRMDEVLCLDMPQAAATVQGDASTNQTAEMPPLRPDAVADYVPSYNSNIVSLQSYPGSPAVLLLDFFGGYTPTWGGIAYSRPAGINNVTVRDLWKRVAEDYMPFNINVTTDIKVYLAAPPSSRQRCCFTDTPVTAAGVAYIGSWNWGNDTPCWSVYTTGKNGAEVGGHEPGHTLGLGHQGQITGTTTNEYYAGQGSGPTGWAPIMGVGYYKPVSSWAKGEYQGANNKQDELNVIDTANNNVAYRPDDTGSTLAASRYLEIDSNFNAWAEGVIERSGDTDAFQFTTSGGLVTLSANPVRDWANLALSVTLADAGGNVIASNNPQTVLSAGISMTVPAGTYTFRVTGAGRNDPLTTGFSSYPSLGYYSVAGSVAGARVPDRLAVLEHSPNGTTVGSVPPRNPGSQFAYGIQAGNSGGTFAIATDGTVTVANNGSLDYAALAANTMLPVQFELFVNITNLDNPGLTELNRRVVIAVRQAGANYPIAVTGFNAGLIAPCAATPGAPQATGFDIPNNYCFYQAGLNANPQAGGTGGGQGMPASGLVLSAVDNSTFQLGPFGGLNALLLGYTQPRSGTLTLVAPQAFNSLAVLATSANGGGNGTLIIHFADGSSSQAFALNAQDWYGTKANVAFQGYGRLKLGQSTLSTEDPSWSDPNLYQTTISLAALGLNQPVTSVTFTAPSGGTTLTTAILGLSGSVMPQAPAFVQQPNSVTNSVPAQGVTFRVVAMGASPLQYQWFYSRTGNSGTFTALPGETATMLSLPSVLDPTNAGYFYAVVTNDFGSITSSVASLTIWRTPQITAALSPANLALMAGQTAVFSVSANAASPVSYYWLKDGAPLTLAGATLTLLNVQPANAGDYSVIVSNAFGTATSSSAALSVTPVNYPAAQAVLTDHPIGYWRLDETSGTVAHDYVGGNNGIYNRVLLAQPGYNLLDTHTSARFGVLANNTSLVTNIPIDFATTGSATLSVEAWVNGSTQTSDSGLITRGYGAGGEQFNLDCGGPNHAFRFFVRDIAGNAHVAAGTVTPGNRWHHVVGVCDEPHTNVVLYVDGVVAATTTIVPGSGLLNAADPASFGCRRSGASSGYDLQFVGYMEEVAIYNYALSATRVQAHFNAAANRAPYFTSNPFAEPDGRDGQPYSGSLTGIAIDPNGDTITFSKLGGPAWLNVAANGALSGTPQATDAGTNTFTVRAGDPTGLFATGTMYINVVASQPLLAAVQPDPGGVRLSWTGGTPPFLVEITTNLAIPNWQTIAGPLTETSLVLSPTNASAFYRVHGQ